MSRFLNRLDQINADIFQVFLSELRRILTDSGARLLFFIATLLYPLIFGLTYKNEMARNLPIAVVDESQSIDSRRFARKINSTPEVIVRYDCRSMAEAQHLMQNRKIKGIVYFPRDYGTRIAQNQTATVGIFCDITSFLNYRSVYTAASNVLVDEMHDIQLQRYAMTGVTGRSAEAIISPVPYDDVKLYSQAGGFTSFLVPALLILVLHQTLVLGIGTLNGTAKENNLRLQNVPLRLRQRSLHRVTIGRALAYLGLYLPISAIVLLVIPRWFGLPHIGNLGMLFLFVVPFFLATIFFAMTISSFVKHRDSGIICCIFFSVILLFLSGVAWPVGSMPSFWRYFSYLFPSTPGIQCFVRINSMGAQLHEVKFEYLMLWGQAMIYFFTSTLSLIVTSPEFRRRIASGPFSFITRLSRFEQ